MLSTLPDTPATLSIWGVPHLGLAAWKTGSAALRSPLTSPTSTRRCELCLYVHGGGHPWLQQWEALVKPGGRERCVSWVPDRSRSTKAHPRQRGSQ